MTDPAMVPAAAARTLRSLRTGRGWSLDALASRSGVSRGALVAIEQARGNPSIATLCRISDAFGKIKSEHAPDAIAVGWVWRPAGGVAFAMSVS